MHGLSKSRILAHRQCPRRLWLQVHRPDLLEQDAATEVRMQAGTHAGDVARTLYPDGVLVETDNLREAMALTARLMAEPPRPVFEATFQADGVLVRADLLLPEDGAWRMAEVKSSTSVKPYHLTDAAVQNWVVRQNGLRLSRTEIAHIDNAFVYPGGKDYRGLFAHVDVTAETAELEHEVPEWIAAARSTLAGDDPCTEPGGRCRDPFECPFLNHCTPSAEENDGFPPDVLPRNRGLADALRAEGYADLRDVPEGRLSNPRHIRVWAATRAGQPILDPEAADWVRALGWPRYYMDFETVQFVVPEWAGTRPYQQIPFQWSCHIEDINGELTHREFLADGSHDPRRAFAETLLATLGTQGPILVYNIGTERSHMRTLAEVFPDLAPALEAAIARIVDLLPIARDHYYHPEMRGSWSIKAVLPTIAPDLAYDDLEVSHGGMAQEAFLEMMRPETTEERRAQLYEGLLRYCERDTLAMVRVAHHFAGNA